MGTGSSAGLKQALQCRVVDLDDPADGDVDQVMVR